MLLGSRPDRPPLTYTRLFMAMVLNLTFLQLCSNVCDLSKAYGSWTCHLGSIFVNTPRALVNHSILFGAHGERGSLKNVCTKNVENRRGCCKTHSKEQLFGFYRCIKLKDLWSCIKDNGWFRVALGAVVSPAAYAVMTSSQDSCCPYCSHPIGSWEHMDTNGLALCSLRAHLDKRLIHLWLILDGRYNLII